MKIKPYLAVYLLLLTFQIQTALTCDVSVISVINGDGPIERFAREALEISLILKNSAAVIKNKNAELAMQEVRKAMKKWVNFNSAHSKKPASASINKELWSSEFNVMTEKLGKISENIEKGEFESAHFLLEKIVAQMNYIVCIAYNDPFKQSVAHAELVLLSLRPSEVLLEAKLQSPDSPKINLQKVQRFSSEFSVLLEEVKSASASPSAVIFQVLSNRHSDLMNEFRKNLLNERVLLRANVEFERVRELYSIMKNTFITK
ncbi:MAG: hypothetical protein HQM10_05805 [Candidatus Riflebacteria bacterium]|nr:hypothetical protein [Candidatus Riflebacteria bacterium]